MKDVDFLYTDVWVSMGEDESVWDERVKLLTPYQVNSELLAETGNPAVKLMHCLPAFHDRETEVGKEMYERFGLDGMEVAERGLRVRRSMVWDQAEPDAHHQGPHGRNDRRLRRPATMRIVIALGGNALLTRGEPMTVEHQRANVRVAAPALAPRSRRSTSSSSRTATARRWGCWRCRGPRTRRSRRTRWTSWARRPRG